jgi:hypothetical protein
MRETPHPFLQGARRPVLSIPDTYKGRPIRREVAKGAERPLAKPFGAREQARAAKLLEKENKS